MSNHQDWLAPKITSKRKVSSIPPPSHFTKYSQDKWNWSKTCVEWPPKPEPHHFPATHISKRKGKNWCSLLNTISPSKITCSGFRQTTSYDGKRKRKTKSRNRSEIWNLNISCTKLKLRPGKHNEKLASISENHII